MPSWLKGYIGKLRHKSKAGLLRILSDLFSGPYYQESVFRLALFIIYIFQVFTPVLRYRFGQSDNIYGLPAGLLRAIIGAIYLLPAIPLRCSAWLIPKQNFLIATTLTQPNHHMEVNPSSMSSGILSSYSSPVSSLKGWYEMAELYMMMDDVKEMVLMKVD